ncbi:MAG: hypothetical protein SGJ23_08575 [Alphaproteobacteria bacterium]|nr:hypothetical protein [Alphaproteobacteria bacterium]
MLGLAAALLLGGCASTLDSIWEDEARRNCQGEQGPSRQSDCNDRVDDQMRRNRD